MRPSESKAHLDGIHRYIAKDAPSYATLTVDHITRCADRLIEHPRVGRIVAKYADPNLRKLIVGSYRSHSVVIPIDDTSAR